MKNYYWGNTATLTHHFVRTQDAELQLLHAAEPGRGEAELGRHDRCFCCSRTPQYQHQQRRHHRQCYVFLLSSSPSSTLSRCRRQATPTPPTLAAVVTLTSLRAPSVPFVLLSHTRFSATVPRQPGSATTQQLFFKGAKSSKPPPVVSSRHPEGQAVQTHRPLAGQGCAAALTADTNVLPPPLFTLVCLVKYKPLSFQHKLKPGGAQVYGLLLVIGIAGGGEDLSLIHI